MLIFRYDNTFEGFLSAVFDAYDRKTFPERLIGENEPEPLFTESIHTVITDKKKADRVWKGLQKKLSHIVCNMLMCTWLSEIPETEDLLLRYVRKVFDTPYSIAMNFTDNDVLEIKKIAQKVSKESHYINQFLRFQKTADGMFFGPVAPLYNALPLSIGHLKNRFADQQWLIYDLKRQYGYYYDLITVTEITFKEGNKIIDAKLSQNLLDENELFFQDLWKGYFKAVTIKERINPKLHRQNMPRRFWKYLTEK